ncbi:hypothetical protein CR513_36101, partial [Mucuna pruriens]
MLVNLVGLINCYTCSWSVHVLNFEDLKAIRKIRQKHTWGRQLLNIFMRSPYESYMGITGDQRFMKLELQDREDEDWAQPFITQQQLQ